MSLKAIVLGGGMVGATMARDLARDPDITVTVADVDPANLERIAKRFGVQTVQTDAGDAAQLRRAINPFDVVLGALPSRFGFSALRTIIEAGKNYCDISFMPENALELDALAREKGVVAVVDCGVAPGVSNLIVGHAYRQLDRTDRAAIYVGGLPKARHLPFQYKAPFAPSDVIEEYTRPARMVIDSQVVEKQALSEPEALDFDGIGTLEAFNTDGLRSLMYTMRIPNMTEKTMRYPGHRELMQAFVQTGLFDQNEIDVGGVRVRPRDVIARLMFPKWQLGENEPEFTVMRVIVEGMKGTTRQRHIFELYDEFDRESSTSSMSRTTAYPCTIVARMIAQGRIKQRGVLPPEKLAEEPGLFDHVLAELRARGVLIQHRIE